MELTNSTIAQMLREVAAAYELKEGNRFQVRAYETAATAIEHLTSESIDLWEDNQLDQIPGIGESLKSHLDELFRTGKVRHWEDVKNGIPDQVFLFLNIPGVGPRTAIALSKLGVKNIADLQKKIESGELVKKGYSAKMAEKIKFSLEKTSRTGSKRMLLDFADTQAEKVLDYLRKSPDILQANALGSLRRLSATVGDLDFSISTQEPKKVIDYIVKMPGVSRVLDQGEAKVTLILSTGLQVDFIVVHPDSYGALLQHSTGSTQHNIHLRTLAEKKGYSFSEYGAKKIKTGELIKTETEAKLYGLLNMETPPPELREDTGEIEAALKHQLPKLVELSDIKGDLHLHSEVEKAPSHDIGTNSVEEIVKQAKVMRYEYIGVSDHQPSQSNHTPEQMIKALEERKKIIDHKSSSNNFRILNLLEVDILSDGSLGVPDEALKYLDFALVGIHSLHNMSKDLMTNRIMKALTNPYVKVLTHPTGRLLKGRDSYEADWGAIFKYAAANNKALEINAFPDRLDLPDVLVRQAKDYGVKFVINTDSHHIDQMEYIKYGVAVGRRGWATKDDIVNSWNWTKMIKWLKINK